MNIEPEKESEFIFTGTWKNDNFGEINLQQNNQDVRGSYTYRGRGEIEGIAQGNRLDFRWKDAEKGEGWGFFRAISNGQILTGLWGYASNRTNSNSCIATRIRYSTSSVVPSIKSLDKEELRDLGYDLVLKSACDRALEPLETALKIYQQERTNPQIWSLTKNSYLIDEINIITRLCFCYFQLEDYDKLLKNLTDAVEVRQIVNQQEYLRVINQQVAQQTQSFLTNYIELWRQKLREETDKIAALEKGQTFFQNLAEHLVELGAQQEALLVSESSRARAFADL